MKALVVVACCVMMSGCAEFGRQPVLGAVDGTETDNLDSPRHYTELAEEAAAEKAGPRTCTLKGTMVNCY